MTIVNGQTLLAAAPLDPMIPEKRREHGVSYGLSEAGVDVRIKQDLLLHPFKRFALASTIERFDMPTNMVGLICHKSTWARRGLSVFAGTVAEPDWEGHLTLEIYYYGWRPLRIRAGSGIAQVLFIETKEAASYKGGKYDNQPDMPVPARAA